MRRLCFDIETTFFWPDDITDTSIKGLKAELAKSHAKKPIKLTGAAVFDELNDRMITFKEGQTHEETEAITYRLVSLLREASMFITFNGTRHDFLLLELLSEGKFEHQSRTNRFIERSHILPHIDMFVVYPQGESLEVLTR